MTHVSSRLLPFSVSVLARRGWSRLGSVAIAIALLMPGAALAKDPFRSANPAPISDNTAAAFEAFFKQGNYKTAKELLDKKAETTEPLALAMRASLTYSAMLGEKDAAQKAAQLEAFGSYGQQTRTAADALLKSSTPRDQLRGNMYQAVSYFFDGVYAFTKEGTVRGTPKVLGALQQITKYLDEAEKIDPKDPELNLLRGYLDVYTGIYLPFSTPDKGLERLQQTAAPRYLADRGLAMGYLELSEYGKAIEFVDKALAVTPDNPEVNYLKARILVKQKNDSASLPYFEKALSKKDQLLPGLVREIERAQRKTKERLGMK
jgi:tetratricopeptide (TPR) repeat protein